MSKRMIFVVVALGVWMMTPPRAAAQAQAAQPEPTTYSFVSEWMIARAQWADWETLNTTKTKPVLDKLLADGTILSYGLYTNMVHSENEATHGRWFEATSTAAIEKALAELGKISPNPIVNAPTTKHRDYLLQSQLRRVKAGNGGPGYLRVNATLLAPGKGADWRATWDKYNKALFEEMLDKGTITAYWIAAQQVHTDDPGWIYVVFLAPNPDGVDQFWAAAAERGRKRSADENRVESESFAASTVGSAHRDLFARVPHYAMK